METEFICLVLRAKRGDASAFDALVRRLQDRVVAYARSLVPGGDPTCAEDAAKEAFVQAWRDLPRLREPAAFPAWLRRIVVKFRARARRSERLDLVPLDAPFHIAGGLEPGFATLAAEDSARVRSSLNGLPEREREATLLYYLGERDLAEIAAFLDVPKTTVKNRLHTARRRLREELWEMAEEILPCEKPSRDDTCAGKVLTGIMEEFRRQMREDPHTADRGLLVRDRKRPDAALAAVRKPG